MAGKARRRLTNIRPREVSIVDEAANERDFITIKNKEGIDVKGKTKQDLLKGKAKDGKTDEVDTKEVESLCENLHNGIKKAGRKMAGNRLKKFDAALATLGELFEELTGNQIGSEEDSDVSKTADKGDTEMAMTEEELKKKEEDLNKEAADLKKREEAVKKEEESKEEESKEDKSKEEEEKKEEEKKEEEKKEEEKKEEEQSKKQSKEEEKKDEEQSKVLKSVLSKLEDISKSQDKQGEELEAIKKAATPSNSLEDNGEDDIKKKKDENIFKNVFGLAKKA